jgi:hypothetical protein
MSEEIQMEEPKLFGALHSGHSWAGKRCHETSVRTTIQRMSFRVDRRHWIAFLLLFTFNIAGLLLTVRRSGMPIDSRTTLLMISCSSLIAALTALVLVFILDKLSAKSRGTSKG